MTIVQLFLHFHVWKPLTLECIYRRGKLDSRRELTPRESERFSRAGFFIKVPAVSQEKFNIIRHQSPHTRESDLKILKPKERRLTSSNFKENNSVNTT
jgi:hypothetical protein